MKYLPLLWAGLWRKPVRTTLTFLFACGGIPASRFSLRRERRVRCCDRACELPSFARFQRDLWSCIAGWLSVGGSTGTRRRFDHDLHRYQRLLSATAAPRTGALTGRQLAQRFGWKGRPRARSNPRHGFTPVSVNTILGRLEYLRAYVEECASTPSRNNPARAQKINGGAFRCGVLPYHRKHRLEARILAKRREARLQFSVVPPMFPT